MKNCHKRSQNPVCLLANLWFIVLLLFSNHIFAGPNQVIPTQVKSGIRIKLTQCFSTQPRFGYAPIRITISNDSDSTHSWDFTFQSPGRDYGNRGNTITLQKSFAVSSETERSFDLLVPLALITPGQYINIAVNIQVNGYGVTASSINLDGNNGGGNGARLSLGYSTAIENQCGPTIQKKLDDNRSSSNDFSSSAIDFALLPADWRALSGFDVVWITEQEWGKLSTETRLAIEQWVATGGILYRSSSISSTPPNGVVGFGEIRTFFSQTDAGTFSDFIIIQSKPTTGLAFQLASDYRTHWPDKTIIPPYAPNSVLLISIIVLFGIVVGPVNFFLLANKEKRHRIFWTTPLISIVGALLVGLTILVQDGFNGWGRRLAFIHLLPEQNFEVLLQEQSSRTGLLTGSEFFTDPTALLQSIPLDTRGHTFATDGKNYSGEYFGSRRIQGQWLSAVRSSRAKIQLLNARELDQGKPPVILSSISATLDDFYWVDAQSEVWHATNLGPGKSVMLVKTNQTEMQRQLTASLEKMSGPGLASMRQKLLTKPNYFYATAQAPQGALLPTLDSIQWRDDRVFYLGPVTTQP